MYASRTASEVVYTCKLGSRSLIETVFKKEKGKLRSDQQCDHFHRHSSGALESSHGS